MAASVGGDDLYVWYDGAWGSASLFFKEINKNVLNTMLGFASGVMIAASFWSLLDPAIARAEENGDIPWLVVSIGFGLGGLFLYAADKTLPHMHFGPNHETEGLPSHLKRTILLVFSITLHNIPEGLAVGVRLGRRVPMIREQRS